MNLMNQIGYFDESMVKIAQDKHDNAKRKSIVSSKQKINGRLYPGKTTKMKEYNLKAVAALIGFMIIGTSIIAKEEVVTDYRIAVDQINSENFTSVIDEINYHNYKKDNPNNTIENITEVKEIVSQINEEKKELKETGNYGLFDVNTLRQDAINNVASENAANYLQEVRDFYEEEKSGKSL